MDLYCLSNFIDYSESIETPLKHTTRIKYTCFDISANYLIFGATSGSLYVFNRKTCKFLHLIPTKHGVVTQLAISPNEKYVAFATQRATICVYAVNLSASTAPHIIYTQLSNGLQVTCIQWKKQDEKQFYYGDSKGQVNLVLLSSFIGRSLLTMTAHPLLFLDSPIVQIDDFESLLLVSNSTKCILCNTEYEEYKQIGNRPREGAFGATFAISSNEIKQPSRIYCARPGSRVWEVDFEGDVIQTHQFKKSLAIPPVSIYTYTSEAKCEGLSNDDSTICSDFGEENVLDYQPQTLQFWKLQMLTTNFLLAFTEMALYIFDMRTSTVVLWCNQFERILDARVVDEEIFVFTKTGSLYSVHLATVQSYALNLVFQEKLLECACLMRKHVKYFADQAHEKYELKVLNHIKNFLIDRLEYELLNDLSVIFDAIAQCEGNADNNSSCGSSATADKCSSGGGKSASSYCNKGDSSIYHQREPKELYVLENSFCDNLKPLRGDKQIKDSLLTVTGKFGKNIIKYKFNIFADEQRKLVNDLLPPDERNMPFKDVNAVYEQDAEIVCRTPVKKSRESLLSGDCRKTKLASHSVHQISAEEKTIYNLYLICKSAKMSNTNCVDRYRAVFDEYTAPELIELLKKLELVMLDQGESPDSAKKSCYEMYFHYLNPDLIFEMDNNTRNFITEGFIMLNATDNIVRCDNCAFPLRFDNSCTFHELGSVLLRYFWSRNEQIKCFDVLMQVPALLDVLAKFYMTENNLHKVLSVIMNYGQPNLLMDLGKSFNVAAWARCFEQFVQLQQGKLTCINCDCIIEVENVNRHFFYTWNCFLNIILEHLPTQEILLLIFKWSNFISNDAIDREFYVNCLLKE